MNILPSRDHGPVPIYLILIAGKATLSGTINDAECPCITSGMMSGFFTGNSADTVW